MTEALRRAVAAVAGDGALLPESALDGWPAGRRRPAAVVAPASEEEMARLLATATAEGWRVLPAGLSTWMDGAGVPEVDLILSTRRLESLVDYEPSDLTFTAGGGVPWKALAAATRDKGQWLPLDPPGQGRGTLGALAATGVSGPLRHAYGSPRDHVLGLTLISGDGRILRWGGRVVKNVAGFDVTRLSIGSWGTLGIITSVSARLFPLPEKDVTLLLPGPSAEALLPLARELAGSALPFSAVELLDPVTPLPSGPAERWGGGGAEGERPVKGDGEGRAAVALRLLGSAPQVEEMEGKVAATVAGTLTGSRSWWRLEGSESVAFSDALGEWEVGAALVLRLGLLPSRLPRALEEAGEILRRLSGVPSQGGEREGGRRGAGGTAFGGPRLAAHVGWGVVRVAVPSIPAGSVPMGTLAGELGALRRRLEADGGSLVLSRAPLDLMEEVGAWGAPGPEIALMRGLKAEFDPSGILAPGRFGV